MYDIIILLLSTFLSILLFFLLLFFLSDSRVITHFISPVSRSASTATEWHCCVVAYISFVSLRSFCLTSVFSIFPPALSKFFPSSVLSFFDANSYCVSHVKGNEETSTKVEHHTITITREKWTNQTRRLEFDHRNEHLVGEKEENGWSWEREWFCITCTTETGKRVKNTKWKESFPVIDLVEGEREKDFWEDRSIEQREGSVTSFFFLETHTVGKSGKTKPINCIITRDFLFHNVPAIYSCSKMSVKTWLREGEREHVKLCAREKSPLIITIITIIGLQFTGCVWVRDMSCSLLVDIASPYVISSLSLPLSHSWSRLQRYQKSSSNTRNRGGGNN